MATTTVTYRLIISRGEITETDEIELTRTAVAPLPMTFGALAPDGGTGPLAYLLTNDPAMADTTPGGLTSSEVRVAANGKIMIAPRGTAEPADVTAAWGTGWVELGYANEDGVTLARSVEREDQQVWQSVTPVRRLLTGVELTTQFTAVQWNRATTALWFGGGQWVQPDATAHPDLWRFDISAIPRVDERMLGIEWSEQIS